ncbi:hypothetical protein N5853_06140 [Bartonella sp. HY329]|uniref:hypothetical protein n=1 Tax=unclassified Bartonella TaxID=2645622 RepID=UPI0021C7B114|nr:MULTISPECIES: hypothetical protein [unclassified Bartonella]UXM96187.1 hypothetical protein N5853_06140 [Bartonella sp. HY329]UXN10511.1 hypothetical protein N5852_06145 [Bartonella sp. HY328]
MTHSMIARYYPEINRGVKGGIKLDFDMLCAYTNERYLVPIEHPDALIFAGVTVELPATRDPATGEAVINQDSYDMFMQGFLDNTNGQDGDKNGQCFIGTYGFPVASLTQPLEVSLQDHGQIIYASGNRTLHKTPGKGRFPIGIYLVTAPMQGANPTELFHWIDTNVNLPRYKA